MISINLTLPAVRAGQPSEVDGYMIVARDLLKGVEALSTLPNVPPRAAAMIGAHALECALKAFLCHKGKMAKLRDPKVQHDLLALWKMAYQEKDLKIPQAPPDWCTILASGHGPQFYFRYQKGKGRTTVHGGQTPVLVPLAAELKKLIQNVKRSINA